MGPQLQCFTRTVFIFLCGAAAARERKRDVLARVLTSGTASWASIPPNLRLSSVAGEKTLALSLSTHKGLPLGSVLRGLQRVVIGNFILF